MVKYIKNRILLAQSPANLSLEFQAVSSSSLGVTFAGCPDTSSDACLLRGLAIHFPSLLYSWDIWYSKIFVKCNKEMGVLMDVSPQVSPGRQTRAMHRGDPFSANSRILVQVQNMGYVNISEREDGYGSLISESESQSSNLRETISGA